MCFIDINNYKNTRINHKGKLSRSKTINSRESSNNSEIRSDGLVISKKYPLSSTKRHFHTVKNVPFPPQFSSGLIVEHRLCFQPAFLTLDMHENALPPPTWKGPADWHLHPLRRAEIQGDVHAVHAATITSN